LDINSKLKDLKTVHKITIRSIQLSDRNVLWRRLWTGIRSADDLNEKRWASGILVLNIEDPKKIKLLQTLFNESLPKFEYIYSSVAISIGDNIMKPNTRNSGNTPALTDISCDPPLCETNRQKEGGEYRYIQEM